MERFKKDSTSPDFIGAVDSLAEGSCYTDTATIKRETQLCKTCKIVIIPMVIRDLTLKSAASSGSFHPTCVMYDEYMFFLIKHQVAMEMGEIPTAVIHT
jgi:regulatory factor X 1/2/3